MSGRLFRSESNPSGLVIEKRGPPGAVLLSIRDDVKLAAPEPEVLRIGEESKRNGTHTMTERQIDQQIKAYRRKRKALVIPLRLVIDTDVVVPVALNPDGPERTTILLAIT